MTDQNDPYRFHYKYDADLASVRIVIGDRHSSMEKQIETIQTMLNKGQTIDESLIALALEQNKPNLVETVLNHGIATLGKKEMAIMLTQQAAEKQWRPQQGLSTQPSSFHILMERGNTQLLRQFLDILDGVGMDITKVPNHNNLITSCVVMDQDPTQTQARIACIEQLIQRGVSVEAFNPSSSQAIHSVNSEAMLRFLVAQGADIRAKDHRGNRPLYTLWTRRQNLQYGDNEAQSIQETMNIAQAMIELGATWKDAPTLDIMTMQLNNHPLSEYLIAGRKRGELLKHLHQRPGLISTPEAAPAPVRKRTPMF